MTEAKKTIQEVDLTENDRTNFKHRYVGCIVLTYVSKFLLQEIVDPRPFFPAGSIVTFGGKIEVKETPVQALIRELHEELGAKIHIHEPIYLGAITEEATHHSELIYAYFWHDRLNTITGCYEDNAKYFNNVKMIFENPHVADDVRWMLNECQHRQLL